MISDIKKQQILANMNVVNVFPYYVNSLTAEEQAHPDIALKAVSLDGLVLLYVPLLARSDAIVATAVKNSRLAQIYSEHSIYSARRPLAMTQLRIVA